MLSPPPSCHLPAGDLAILHGLLQGVSILPAAAYLPEQLLASCSLLQGSKSPDTTGPPVVAGDTSMLHLCVPAVYTYACRRCLLQVKPHCQYHPLRRCCMGG